ncbi:MAG: LamG-like jellyroll fold domain-containing protein, partial [Myxococcota bacterium]|nr:LamG-like jellyroll fold domain-containing protein [Myxococcota bacterium]
ARIDLDLTAGGLLGGIQVVLSGPGGENTYNNAIEIAIPDYVAPGFGQVTIETPNNNSTFTANAGPVDVEVSFNIVDWVPSEDGIIKFFEDGEEVGSQMVLTPYTFTNLKSGQHSLTVGLFDDAGNLMNSDGSHDSIVVRVEGSCSVDADCDDGNPCSNFTCSAGTCKYGPTGIACCQTNLDCASDEVCSTTNECVKCENDVDCIDGVACTYERCLNNGTCLEENPEGCCITPADCDDGKSCTAEDCVDNTCVFVGEFNDTMGAKAADARVHDATDGTPAVDELFASPIRIGKVNVGDGSGMGNLVIPFEMPELPDGHTFVSVDFQVRVFGSDMTAAKPFNGDLYALPRRLNPDVLGADFWAGEQDEYATLIQDDFLEPGVPNLSYLSLSGSSRDTLLDFMNAQYKNGVGAGQFIFMRLSPDVGALSDCTQGSLSMSGFQGAAYRPEVTLDMDNDWAIEAWIRPNSFGEVRNIVEYGSGEERSFRLQVSSVGQLECVLWQADDLLSEAPVTVQGGAALTTGEWTHVAMAYDEGQVRCYAGGELTGTAEANSPGQKAVKEPFTIGGDASDTSTRVFDGNIAFVHLNNKAKFFG